ncbi:MAG: phospholipid carrier-dependent glycosyltransferase, partial [Candidatus Dormibacteria bacterium]
MQGAALSLGMASLLVSTAALVHAAQRAARALFPGDAIAALVATILFFNCAVVLVLELLGVLGLIATIPLLLSSLAVGLAVGRIPLVTGVPSRPLTPFRPWTRHVAAAAMVGAVLAAMVLESVLVGARRPGPEFDAMTSHLPLAVQWLQTGAMRGMPFLAPISIQQHYPANSELLALWLMVPVHRDFLAQLAGVPGVLLTVTGTYMGARLLGARALPAAIAPLLVLTLSLVLVDQVGTNMEDLQLLGALATMTAFAVRQDRRPGWANVLAAGFAAGLGVGSRYAGLLAVMPTTAVLLWLLATRLPRRQALLGGALFLTATVLVGGFFYGRNAFYTGDPVYPQSLPGLSVHATEQLRLIPLRSYLQAGWRPGDWAASLAGVFTYYGPLFLLLLAAALILPFLAVAVTGIPRRWAILPALSVAIFLALPGSAGQLSGEHLDRFLALVQVRYILPALTLTAMLLPAVTSRRDERGDLWGWAGLGGVGAAVSLGLVVAHPPIPGRRLSLPLLLLALVICFSLLALAARRPRIPRPAVRCALGGMALMVVAAGGGRWAAAYDAERLSSVVPFENLRLHLPAAARVVDVVGICRLHGLYGP